MTHIGELPSVQPRRVLIVRLGSLGDSVLSVPALRIIRNWLHSFPQPSPVTVLGQEFGRYIFPRVLPVDRFFNFGSMELLPLFSSKSGVPEATLDLLGWPDAAIIWLRDHRSLAVKLREAGCSFVLSGESFPEDNLTHVSDHLRLLLEPLGVDGFDMVNLPVGHSERHNGQILSGRYANSRQLALIHPGSGSSRKNWPARNFAELMGELPQQRWDVRVLRGPADTEAVAELLRASSGPSPLIVEPASVGDLCGVLAAVDLVVSNDSGVAHLSAALGRPTVAVFGPTNVFRWAPRGASAVTVVSRYGNDWPSVGEVAEGCVTALGHQGGIL